MSAPRTQSQVIERLDSELAWRERELITFKQEIKGSIIPWQTTLIRAAVPLLYAHWEGFVKLATETVIDFVGLQRLPYKELSKHYWAIGLAGRLSSLASGASSADVETVEYVLSMSDRVTRFRAHNHIETASNLSSRVFVKIASTIGIVTDGYEVRFPLLDRELLGRRNHIAHGQQLSIDAASYYSLESEVRKLLRQYHADLQNYVVLDCYRSS